MPKFSDLVTKLQNGQSWCFPFNFIDGSLFKLLSCLLPFQFLKNFFISGISVQWRQTMDGMEVIHNFLPVFV